MSKKKITKKSVDTVLKAARRQALINAMGDAKIRNAELAKKIGGANATEVTKWLKRLKGLRKSKDYLLLTRDDAKIFAPLLGVTQNQLTTGKLTVAEGGLPEAVSAKPTKETKVSDVGADRRKKLRASMKTGGFKAPADLAKKILPKGGREIGPLTIRIKSATKRGAKSVPSADLCAMVEAALELPPLSISGPLTEAETQKKSGKATKSRRKGGVKNTESPAVVSAPVPPSEVAKDVTVTLTCPDIAWENVRRDAKLERSPDGEYFLVISERIPLTANQALGMLF